MVLSTQWFNPYVIRITRVDYDMTVYYTDGRIVTFKDFYRSL